MDTLGRLRHQAAELAERERALVRLGARPVAEPVQEAVQEAPKIPASFREGLAALERASEERRRQPDPTACIRCGGCERCSCSTS